MSPTDTRILIIVAGTNEPSNSDYLADKLIEGMKTIDGVVTEKIKLRETNLHHFTLADYAEESCEPDYNRLKKAVLDASAVIIATPIWNFSVPSHLKNFIDRMGAFGLDSETHSKGQFNSKPFGIVYTGGAPMIAWKALMYLTTLHVAEAIKYYDGSIVLRHFEPRSVAGKGKFGLVVDKRPQTIELMQSYGRRVAKIAVHYKENNTLPFGNRMWQKWFEFLYRVGNRIMYPISKMQ